MHPCCSAYHDKMVNISRLVSFKDNFYDYLPLDGWGQQSISSLIATKIPSKIDIGFPTQLKQTGISEDYWSLLYFTQHTHICQNSSFNKHMEWFYQKLAINGDASRIPSSNLLVEAAACFLTSSASKESNKGWGGVLLLNFSIAEIIFSATYKCCSSIKNTKQTQK